MGALNVVAAANGLPSQLHLYFSCCSRTVLPSAAMTPDAGPVRHPDVLHPQRRRSDC